MIYLTKTNSITAELKGKSLEIIILNSSSGTETTNKTYIYNLDLMEMKNIAFKESETVNKKSNKTFSIVGLILLIVFAIWQYVYVLTSSLAVKNSAIIILGLVISVPLMILGFVSFKYSSYEKLFFIQNHNLNIIFEIKDKDLNNDAVLELIKLIRENQ